MCVDPDWKPYEMLDDQGRHVGIVAEYMQLFQQRLGIAIEPVPVKTWAESQQLYRQGRCDIVSALNQTDERARYLDFSAPYLKSPAVLVMRDNEQRIRSLEQMQGYTLAMVKGYVYESSLRRDFPEIRLVQVANMEEGLQRVADGKVDATLGPLFLIAASIQGLGLENLNILGSTPYRDELRIGVRKGDAILLGLMNKSVSGLTGRDHTEAKRRGLKRINK
jgi:ABC-type amino acid transport substrate-binding protein